MSASTKADAAKVAAIVVNYRTPDLTARAVTSLLPELAAAGGGRVIVVENDSGDGSLDALQAAARDGAWGDAVEIVASPRNGGYGYGINVAVAHACARPEPPDFFYVINPDARAAPGTIARMLAFFTQHPKAGIAGNEIIGEDGKTQGACFRFPTAWSELEENVELGLLSRLLQRFVVAMPPSAEDREVDWVPGTSMLVRREVFEAGAYFDEGFFLYFEEIDFCQRARRLGWSTWFVAGAPVIHVGSASTGMVDDTRRMPRYWFESRHRYFLKHTGRAHTALADAAWVTGLLLGRAKRKALGRQRPEKPRVLRDFLAESARRVLVPGTPAPDETRVEPKNDVNGETRPGATDRRPADAVPLLELLAEDLATHDGRLVEPGFWAVAVHRLGTRLAPPAAQNRAPLEAAYRLMATAVDWTWGIDLPRTVALGRRVRIWHNGGMVLDARSIGNDVHLRHDTTFGPVRDAERAPENLPSIEDRADIGSGVCVLGNVTIGHDAMVGANSVVLKPVPPHATVLGVPARLVPT